MTIDSRASVRGGIAAYQLAQRKASLMRVLDPMTPGAQLHPAGFSGAQQAGPMSSSSSAAPVVTRATCTGATPRYAGQA